MCLSNLCNVVAQLVTSQPVLHSVLRVVCCASFFALSLSPSFGYALVLPAVSYALLPAVGFARLPAVGFALSVLFITHQIFDVLLAVFVLLLLHFILLAIGSLSVVPSLVLTTGSFVYDSVVRF